MPRMHADELEIDEALVRRLLVEQFPDWSDLPLARVEPPGTDNAIFRVGEGLAVRLARRHGPTAPGGKEADWLPRLSPLLPLEITVPVAQGRPGARDPRFWGGQVGRGVDGAGGGDRCDQGCRRPGDVRLGVAAGRPARCAARPRHPAGRPR